MTNYNEVVLNDKDWKQRYHALEHVTDQSVLAKVALNEYDWRIRGKAIEKLTDQNVLAQIAINDDDWKIAVEATKKVTNQQLAKKIYIEKQGNYENVCLVAIKNIYDQNILIDLFFVRGDNMQLMNEIINKLTDDAFLLSIALNDTVSQRRITAINRIKLINSPYAISKLKAEGDYLVKRMIS
ncbi:MAG: hypothetical protein E7311_02190 [Clostridiales bacterium]|nr:hypothetical protein [Clostridiales bacterium]